jgi:hypothetical protein
MFPEIRRQHMRPSGKYSIEHTEELLILFSHCRLQNKLNYHLVCFTGIAESMERSLWNRHHITGAGEPLFALKEELCCTDENMECLILVAVPMKRRSKCTIGLAWYLAGSHSFVSCRWRPVVDDEKPIRGTLEFD